MKIDKKPPYESVLAVTFLLLLVHYFFYFEQPKFLVVSLLFVLLCLLSKRLSRWVATAWDFVTRSIGWVMNNVLLSVVFFLLLTPLAIVYRLFKKNTFYKSPAEDSYFVDRDHQFRPEDLENPW